MDDYRHINRTLVIRFSIKNRRWTYPRTINYCRYYFRHSTRNRKTITLEKGVANWQHLFNSVSIQLQRLAPRGQMEKSCSCASSSQTKSLVVAGELPPGPHDAGHVFCHRMWRTLQTYHIPICLSEACRMQVIQ